MRLVSQFGIDFGTVNASLPTVVVGRVLHIDADFCSYHGTLSDEDGVYPTADESIERMVIQGDTLRALAAAESMCFHFTHPDSPKAGRYDAAIQQAYQDNRVVDESTLSGEQLITYLDRQKHKECVKQARICFHKRYNTVTKYYEHPISCHMETELEADDSITIAMYADKDSVIWSPDKDLRMGSGKHLVEGDYYIKEVNGFGGCYLKDGPSGKENKGYGTCWFWHQMLQGDGADNIKGCAKLSKVINDREFPNKQLLDAYERIKVGRKLTKANQTALDRGPANCGHVTTHELLKDCKTDMQCLTVVAECYQTYYGNAWYSEYTGKTHHWTEIFYESAKLLWMQRTRDVNDFKLFIQEVKNHED